MSKILEALKARTQETAAVSQPAPHEVSVEKTGRELTQEQLAEIYFSTTGKPRTSEAPMIIHVVEKQRLAALIPWIITSIAFLVTALSLFSTKRVFIDVKVVDEKNPYLALWQERSREVPMRTHGRATETSETVSTIEGHPIFVEGFHFEGAAYLKSSKDPNGLTLVNSSVAPFARASAQLVPPIDLTKSKIVFYAKGGRGGENVAFAMKDRENVQAFRLGKLYPFPNGLTTEWQKAEILLDENIAAGFDPKNVTSLRLEFGAKDTDNKPGDTVFIKDLQWAAL